MASAQSRGRRQHTKSRRGCGQCKYRKVKCDETHPDCLNCCRLGLRCSFRNPLSSAPVSPPGLSPKRTQSDSISHMLDLRLLHYYVTSACATFPLIEDRRILDYWSITVPKMAFENECLFDAVLGATALHMSARLPTDRQLPEAAHRYYSRAICKLRYALSSVDAATADPLCAAGIFTMLMTFTTSHPRSVDERYTPPARWFRVISGMGCLIRHAQPFLRDDGIYLLMHKEHPLPDRDRLTSELPQLPDLGELLSLSKVTSDIHLDQVTKASRRSFWNAVNQSFLSAVRGASRHSVRYQLLGLAASNDEHFMRSVEYEDLFTMIILSHYFALLEWCGGNWWLQDALSSQLPNLLAIVPPEYQWAVARPNCAPTDAEGSRR